jgi:hypothetical protein
MRCRASPDDRPSRDRLRAGLYFPTTFSQWIAEPRRPKHVSKTDIANLAAYLRSFGRPGEPVFVEWWNGVLSRWAAQPGPGGKAASTSSTLAISTCSANRSFSILSAASWASSTLLATASSAMTQR